MQLKSEVQRTAAAKDDEIQALQAKLDKIEEMQRLVVTGAVTAVKRERDDLKSDLEQVRLEKRLA